MPFKPMLAAKLEDIGELEDLKYPVMASPKIDGVRAIVLDRVVYSRSMKPIPNQHVQKMYGRREYEGFDGELVVGAPYASNCMQATMSGVMREEGEPNVCFYVFDRVTHGSLPWWERREDYRPLRADQIGPAVLEVPQHQCHSAEEVSAYEQTYLRQGYEGLMLRAPDGLYKQGRCGKKQPWLIKVKRFDDAEALVVGAVERMHNENEAEEDELGHTKRSTHQENMVPMGDLGAFVCKTPDGIQFQCGTGLGLTLELRKQLWDEHLAGKLVGLTIKYKSFTRAGVKEAPRFPVWLGFRDERDL